MDHTFDKQYWEDHWRRADAHETGDDKLDPNPYLAASTADLTPGRALDAGCGQGTEAIWLALRGWTVTAIDISTAALDHASEAARQAGVVERVSWINADLMDWHPVSAAFDLVTTSYVHPETSATDMLARLASLVASRGTLLVVAHQPHEHDVHRDHQDDPPPEATLTTEQIQIVLPAREWAIASASENTRQVSLPNDRKETLHDSIVLAHRLR